MRAAEHTHARARAPTNTKTGNGWKYNDPHRYFCAYSGSSWDYYADIFIEEIDNVEIHKRADFSQMSINMGCPAQKTLLHGLGKRRRQTVRPESAN